MNSQHRSQETREKHIKNWEKRSKIARKSEQNETKTKKSQWPKTEIEWNSWKKRNSHVWISLKFKLISIGEYDQFDVPKSTLYLHRSKFIRFGTNHHLMQVVHILLNHRTHSSCVCHSSVHTQSANYHRHQPELKSRLALSIRITKQPTTTH